MLHAMPSRILTSLLAVAIVWVSLFSFGSAYREAHKSIDPVAASSKSGSYQGSLSEHHLDDVPLQAMDSSFDLPDHQLVSASAAQREATPGATPLYGSRHAGSTWIEGLLRPPIASTSQA